MDIEHDLVLVDEFDALSIEVKGVSYSSVLSREEKYPAKTHAKKVVKELGVKSGLIYLPGLPSQTYEDSDMGPVFRQRRYFYYMAGAEIPDSIVTYDIATDVLILWIPYLDPRRALYLGSVPSREECLSRFDVDEVRYALYADRYVSKHLGANPGTALFVLHDSQRPRLDRHRGFLTMDAGRLRPAMDRARVVKTDYEVRQIRRANVVSSAAHRQVLSRLAGMATESEAEAVFVANCTVRGARRQAYPVIAGSGPNAATLHYDANDEPLEGRQVLVLDAGCEWGCYASDITRTLPLGPSGRFSPEAAAVYSVVDKMQRACIEKVRPGVPYKSLHVRAQAVAVTELLALGVLVAAGGGSAGDVLSSGVVAAFFPHGLGHHVGLEVHDVLSDRLLGHGSAAACERWYGKRFAVSAEYCAALVRAGPAGVDDGSRLAEGMIVTIEPGIYFNHAFIKAFIEESPKLARFINLEVVEKYYPVGGVRIEDDILVTADGYENLTTAPKGEEALRIINQS